MGHLDTFWLLLRRSFISMATNGNFGVAKGAAYSALLSFFPVLTTAAALLVQARAEFVRTTIENFLEKTIPPGTEQLVLERFAVHGARPAAVPASAMALSVLAATGVIMSLLEGFREAYRIPSGRSILRERLVAVLLVFSAAIPVLVASALILFGGRIQRWIGAWIGLLPANVELEGWVALAGDVARYLISLGAIVLGVSILYRFGPNRRQRWHYVWPGAVLATFLAFGATVGFAWYARNIAHYNVMYGSIAAAPALMGWMYLLAVIALLGCEFNAQHEKLRHAEPAS